MKPHRLKLAHHLILSYGLYRKMEVYVSAAGRFQCPIHRAAQMAPAPLLRSAGFAHVNEGLSHLKLTCTLFF